MQRCTQTTLLDVRYDGIQHIPDWSETRQKCKFSDCKGITLCHL